MKSLTSLFSASGFMPHGHCYLWNGPLVWTMVSSDFLIGLAYASISICLYLLVRRIKLPFSGMFLAFGLFIAACGLTHFMEIYTLWIPAYWVSAFVKIVTAVASVMTAIWLFPLMKRIMRLACEVKVSDERRVMLEDLTSKLRAKTVSLEAVNQELEAFCHSVSHDLRAPLRSMMGFSNSVLDDFGDKLEPQARADINRVINAAKKMGDLVDGLLNLSKLTRGDILNVPVNLSQLVSGIATDLQATAPQRQVSFVIEDDLIVRGDPHLLQAALVNLLTNAWKFTGKTENARIEFGKKDEDKAFVYFVKDNGVGFDMQFSNKLFGTFQRLHPEREFPGTGIGLATVQRIIKRHGGEVWAHARVSEGATFYFTI